MYHPKNKNDEWQTLDYGVTPLIEFLPKDARILCPFDDEDSAFVRVLRKAGFHVDFSHISPQNQANYRDFFDIKNYDVVKYDFIISNPPYSIRKQVFAHLDYLERPFAMLVPLVSIALKPIREKLANKQLLIFDRRLKFKSPEGLICKNPPSETAYVCQGLAMPTQIVYRQLGAYDG